MNSFVKDENKKVLLAYLGVCIIWGSTYLAIRIGVSEFPPELFAGIRFLIAGALMLLFGIYKGMQFPKTKLEFVKISIVGLFLLLGGNGMVVWAEQWVHSGMASLLVATVPLFMAVIELLIPNSPKLSIKGWLGLLIGFGGVALLVLTNSKGGSIDMLGAGLLMIGSISWAAGSVYSKGFKASGSTVSHIAIEMLAGGAGLTIFGLLVGEASQLRFTSKSAGAMIYLIIFGSIIGYSCYIYILKKWPAAKAGTYAYVNPPVAVLLGTLVLGEPLSIQVVFATAVILGGVVLVQSSKTLNSRALDEISNYETNN